MEKLKRTVVLLTGTLRGKERDELIQTPGFKRFLSGEQTGQTVYLLSTSAGEVGIDLSSDHMICDLTPFDSMIQRFGRVNRLGLGDATIDVVYGDTFDEKDPLKSAREKTLELLTSLNGDASPLGLMNKIDSIKKIDAFTPEPAILPVTDILFDAWALTAIREKMPGRPPVEPYLHGIGGWEPPETYVAWREEVEVFDSRPLSERYDSEELEDLLEDYPLKPHELLRDRSDRVFKHLQKLVDKDSASPVWIIDQQNRIRKSTLGELTKDNRNERDIEYATILLSPQIGGLAKSGMLSVEDNSDVDIKHDVAEEWLDENSQSRRVRTWSAFREAKSLPNMRLIRTIDTDPEADEGEENESNGKRFWHWYVRLRSSDDDMSKTNLQPVEWGDHTQDVETHASNLARILLKDNEDLREAVTLAAKWHDLGKKRESWQRSIGNPNPSDWYAKSGKKWTPVDCCPNYRHEFGSLLDIQDPKQEFQAEFERLGSVLPEMPDVVLHLIAAHHGYARPHFPLEKACDRNHSDRDCHEAAVEVVRRFARLQRRYGRWGLAYLESLLRAADWAASANPYAFTEEKQEVQP